MTMTGMAVTAVDDRTRERNDLMAVYRERSPLEQQIVQFAAILYGPIARAELGRCLEQCGFQEAGKLLTTNRLLAPVDRLRDAGLLVRTPNYEFCCAAPICELVTREAVATGFFDRAVRVIRKHFPTRNLGGQQDGPRFFENKATWLREVRIALYQNQLAEVWKLVDNYERLQHLYREPGNLEDFIELVFTNPFDRDWLRQLPHDFVLLVLSTILFEGEYYCQPVNDALELAATNFTSDPQDWPLQQIVIEHYLLRGDFATAQQWLERLEPERPEFEALRGWLAFVRGDREGAIAHYQATLERLKQAQKQKNSSIPNFLTDTSGLFFILALQHSQSPEQVLEAEIYANLLARQETHWLIEGYEWLSKLLEVREGNLEEFRTLARQPLPELGRDGQSDGDHSLAVLLGALCLYWLDRDVAAQRVPPVVEPLLERAAAGEYAWLAVETAELLQRLDPNHRQARAVLDQYADLPRVPLVDCLPGLETWELCLEALTRLDQPEASPTETSKRLAWFVTYRGPGDWELQAREQKVKSDGDWSRGRIVSLQRLWSHSEIDYLTAQDRRICSCIEVNSSDRHYYYNKPDYRFNERALRELVGHPLVFWEDSRARIDIVAGDPELLVQQMAGDRLTLSLSPALPDSDSEIILVKETPTRLKVVAVKPEHYRIAKILGSSNALTVPLAARDRVLAVISSISSLVAIQSDIGGGNIEIETVDSDPTPHLHLLPAGEGLRVQMFVQPFAGDGPYYQPGTGGETVITEVEGRRLQTRRDLAREQELAAAAIAACPSLASGEVAPGEWQLDDPEACLELLVELRELGDRLVLAWPEGEKLRVSAIADSHAFRMSVHRQQDWFEASGELSIDDERVLDMQQLLALLDETPGRFLRLGEGEFLALTQNFRKRLEDLRAFGDRHGNSTRLHPLAVPALTDFAAEIGQFEADQHWREHLQRFEEVQALQPEIPSTLQAELRDYQVEGFRWLARLAHWGVGACLADDMGLGKTLQALAVILTRAPQGPTLVVAPTSVGANWLKEAQRFAPTLNGIGFGTGDRQAILDNLQPFDLVVCSYGLLQQAEVGKMLAKVEWQTIVLDEAQAIKNAETQRSQAAMQLKSGFKMIATGTPIENHLGELWNLFRFINPGLLGSQKRFNQLFAVPIERYKDKGAKAKLKKLIQPFLLRRTKSQVLDELPSRTEILLPVELSTEEIALYEALRREAVEKLENTEAEAGAKHLQVLAEIMRLRRFCCNPNLVKPELELGSSKLEAFSEIVEELLANRHKALVFSQFVDHLKIIRTYLERENIRYQYLDGSTPAKARQQRVEAFQSGDGDIFLISLKAGGTGLNLTAADYVIHMDPWWNPAVEDQASDRAHRIGQQRPVTIYRLVAKHTIEEKIVELHHHKRDLADSLLADSDGGGRLSTNELLQLLSER